MERRYQVFVSSTFLDLKEERAAVVSAILELEAIPAGMELFPAADEDAWSLIERVITESDYYLLVIGGRYGSVDPDTEVSFTEKEYDFAIAQGRPVMAFLHGDPDAIPLGKSEKDEKTRAKLMAFREKVEAAKHVKFWSGPEDLAGKVSRTFATFRQRYPAVGWVRGDVQTSTESLNELNELRKQLARAEERLEASRSGPPPGAEALAQGSDPASFVVTGSTTMKFADYPYSRDYGVRFQIEEPWDRLFSAVGPLLLDEADERVMKRAVDKWLTAEFRDEVRHSAIQTATEEDAGELTGLSGTSVALGDENFGTVLVQLRALGLITRSERKRSVSDKATYWALTPYGDEHLTTLRAIRRDDAASSDNRNVEDAASPT